MQLRVRPRRLQLAGPRPNANARHGETSTGPVSPRPRIVIGRRTRHLVVISPRPIS